MRLGEIKFHGIINNYFFQHGSLAVASSLEKCLAAAESPFSLAILTSVHYLAAYQKADIQSSGEPVCTGVDPAPSPSASVETNTQGAAVHKSAGSEAS